MGRNSVTVFSTESGRHCAQCGLPLDLCICKKDVPNGTNDGVIRVRREKQGRGGKEVTVIRGVPGTGDERKNHVTTLKKKFGTGGSEKNGVIEIQGDRVNDVIAYFKNLNLKIKKDGG